MVSWPGARGWNKRIEGGSISTSRNDSPPCTNPLASQLLQLLSSHGLLYLCLGWLKRPVIRINKRGVGPRPASLHPVAQPPPQSGKIPSPVRGPYPQTSDDDATSDVGLMDPASRKKGRRSRGNRGSRSGESSDSSHSARSSTSSGGRRKKKDGFFSKIQIPEFGGKKGHSGDVTDAFRQWAMCITYYRDYYEYSYLMPLVVSSLTGDASDVFDWILSLNHGERQDLTTLLQMLREHYCGSLTFREQGNMIENLHQKPNEAAIDFLIKSWHLGE